MATNDTSRMKNKIETLEQRIDNMERALSKMNELVVENRQRSVSPSMTPGHRRP